MPRDTRLFEHLITAALAAEHLSSRPGSIQTEELDGASSPERLARHLAHEVERTLRALGGDSPEKRERQVAIVNELLATLRSATPKCPSSGEDVIPPPRLLLSVHDGDPPPRTELPFALTTLLTRARGEPSLGHELEREIASSQGIDALISFVTRSGVRALQCPIERFAASGRRFRLLTTTYTGATDADAVDLLARLPGIEVRISYDARRTRLHAKAWLFSRESGLDTAYVGSANLSSAALFHGHEWMVKVSASDLPTVVAKVRGTFETLWNDPEFERYDPNDDEHRARLRQALASEKGGARGDATEPLAFFTLRPYPFQNEILDRLDAARRLHGRRRNLVVAATGTGKTVIAAFDYRRRMADGAPPPKLLFLAHREEILKQALGTFRNVMRDGAFGELLVEGSSPQRHDHLFASIQSFNSRGLLQGLGPAYWDHVVVDECHHAPADSYRAVMDSIRPAVLVGLTATPERTDGASLLPDFDGHVTAELRLWHALERQLLSPFEYYGISDNTDLQAIRWSRGAYAVDELDKLYTGDDRRAELVIEQLRRRVGSVRSMRALGFCVSVAHAEFMARKFTDAGISAIALHGRSDDRLRIAGRGRLERREINAIFTCDLYNEGVDLPFVDTLLLLRPTSSATLFLQQLGRGLRLSEGKESCLVLDFIGQHHEEFRFDRILSALTGLPRGGLQRAVGDGFPFLPSGCHLELDHVARTQVLESLRRTLRGGLRALAEELRTVAARRGADVSLSAFLEDSGRELGDIFTDRVSWSRLKREAGLPVAPPGPREEELSSKLALLLHLDEPERIDLYASMLAGEHRGPLDPISSRRLLMLAYQLFHAQDALFTADSLVEIFRRHPAISAELVELLGVLRDEVALATTAPFPVPTWPLNVHRRYSRREALTAVGHWNETHKPMSREGLVRLEDARIELLFVTLDKSEKRFSPTTSYEDYAISETLFHWQTQSGVSPGSASGRRYLEQAQNGWRFLLFVRPTVRDVYTYLGESRYLSHCGSRPINITWRLDVPIPGHWLKDYERLAA